MTHEEAVRMRDYFSEKLRTQYLEAVVRGWADHEVNQHKAVDLDLAEAIVDELMRLHGQSV